MSSEKLGCYLGVNREGLLELKLKRSHTQCFKKVKLAGVAVDEYVMGIEKADKRITNDRPNLILPVRNLSHNKSRELAQNEIVDEPIRTGMRGNPEFPLGRPLVVRRVT